MKNSCFLFALLALAPLANAVGPDDPPTLGGSSATPPVLQVYLLRNAVSGDTTLSSSPFTYADGRTLAVGEMIKFVYVIPDPGVSFSDIPFSFSADGTLVPGDNVRACVWAVVGNEASTNHGYRLDADGYPIGMGGAESIFTMPICWPQTETFPADCSLYYLYAITFDSRTVNPETGESAPAEADQKSDKAPIPLGAWSATMLYRFRGTTTGLPSVFVNLPFEGSGYVAIATPSKQTSPLSAIEVAGETLTDPAAIEAALKPAIAGMTLAQEGGTPTLSLTLSPAQAPDITTYTLETTDALDGTWVPFDTFLQEKGLANSDAMHYTKWRIKEEGVVSIPIFDDTTRFYRLKGDKNLQGETR